MIMRLRLLEILGNYFNIMAMASNGQEGLDFYAQYNPDFIMLDISMPEKDGLHALHEILSRFPKARVVIMSAVGQRQIVFEALKLGARDFIVKPFDSERVLKSVKRLFEVKGRKEGKMET